MDGTCGVRSIDVKDKVKEGLKKGKYKVTVKVKALGNSNYKASSWKTVTFKVKIK